MWPACWKLKRILIARNYWEGQISAILIMTKTYPISGFWGRTIRLFGVQDHPSSMKSSTSPQLSKLKYIVSAFISSNKRLRGETVLNFLTLASQYNFSRVLCHTQVVEYPSDITRQLFDGGCNTVFTNGFNQPSGKSA